MAISAEFAAISGGIIAKSPDNVGLMRWPVGDFHREQSLRGFAEEGHRYHVALKMPCPGVEINVDYPDFAGNRAPAPEVWRNYTLRILFGSFPLSLTVVVALPNAISWAKLYRIVTLERAPK